MEVKVVVSTYHWVSCAALDESTIVLNSLVGMTPKAISTVRAGCLVQSYYVRSNSGLDYRIFATYLAMCAYWYDVSIFERYVSLGMLWSGPHPH